MPLALGSFQHLSYRRRHIVEADTGRDAADVFKDAFHSLQQTFLVLCGKNLDVGFVRIRERHDQCVGFMLLSLSVVVNEFAEIQLRFSRRVIQRQKAVGLGAHLSFFLPQILLDARIAACVAELIAQSVIDPLTRVTLLARNKLVFFQPFVDGWNELT